MKPSFDGTTVMITGGSSGIGKALAKQIVQANGNVVLIARDEQNLQAVKEEFCNSLQISERQIQLLPLDVTDANRVDSVLASFLADSPTPDYLINCAGVAHPGEFENLNLDIFHWLMDVNYFGTVHMIKAVLPAMLKRGIGHIVNVSSAAGFLGVYGYTAYGASKYAVRGFTDALRSELRLKHIDLSLVFPPDTDTPQLAYEAQFKPAITKELAGNAGILSADQVAASILAGVSRKKYIIVPGFENAFLYHLSNLLGSKVYWVMDQMVNAAVKKIS